MSPLTDVVAHDKHPQVPARRRAAVAAVLPLGTLLWVVEEAAKGHDELSLTAGILSVPFAATYAVIVVVLTRRCTRWALPTGVALGVSLVGLAVVHGMEYAELVQVRAGADKGHLDAVLEATDTVPAYLVLAMFFGGALLGTLMLVVTLWRSAWVPRGAAVLMAALVVLDLGLDQHLLGLAAGAASAAWTALAVLRTGAAVPSPASTPARTMASS